MCFLIYNAAERRSPGGGGKGGQDTTQFCADTFLICWVCWFFLRFIYYFWLHWVFVAAWAFSDCGAVASLVVGHKL